RTASSPLEAGSSPEITDRLKFWYKDEPVVASGQVKIRINGQDVILEIRVVDGKPGPVVGPADSELATQLGTALAKDPGDDADKKKTAQTSLHGIYQTLADNLKKDHLPPQLSKVEDVFTMRDSLL